MRTVQLLQVMLKRDAEWCDRSLAALWRGIRRPATKAMHASRNIAYVIKTEETSAALVERLGPLLDADDFDVWWCFTPGQDIVSSRKGLDSLAFRVKAAHAEVRKRNKADHMRQPQTRRVGMISGLGKKFKDNAPVEVRVEQSRKRRKPRHPNGPKG